MNRRPGALGGAARGAITIRRRRRKWPLVLGAVAALFVLLPGILFVVLVYNPFEGTVERLDQLVPRDITLVLWRTDVGGDLEAVPDSAFAASLKASPCYDSFLSSEEWRDLNEKYPIEDTIGRLPDI